MTLKEFCDYFQQKHRLSVEAVTVPSTGMSLYMSFMKKETKEARMPTKY